MKKLNLKRKKANLKKRMKKRKNHLAKLLNDGLVKNKILDIRKREFYLPFFIYGIILLFSNC
jgi:hypothetical protein